MAQVDTALTVCCRISYNDFAPQLLTSLQMIHELMHAIGIVRYKDDDYEGNCLDRKRSGITAQEPVRRFVFRSRRG